MVLRLMYQVTEKARIRAGYRAFELVELKHLITDGKLLSIDDSNSHPPQLPTRYSPALGPENWKPESRGSRIPRSWWRNMALSVGDLKTHSITFFGRFQRIGSLNACIMHENLNNAVTVQIR
jgi:hypothetical protein